MLIALLAGLASAHVPVTWFAGPSDDWCQTIADAQTGDLVYLFGGDFYGPCAIVELEPPDYPGEALQILAFDVDDPVVFHLGSGDHVLSIDGWLVNLVGLTFRDVPAGAAAIRVLSGDEHWLRDLVIDIAGTGVDVSGDVTQLWVANAEVRGAERGLQLGCPDASCSARSVTIYDGLFVDVGEGIRFEPGSAGSLRDTVIVARQTGASYAGGEGALEENLVVSDGLALELGAAEDGGRGPDR